MATPRCVLPGTTYLVTRRCSLRFFLLRPSKRVNEIFLYCLALAASRFGIDIHAYCVMSNHYHLVITDRLGKLPLFMHSLNQLAARSINRLLGRFESFWAPGTYSAVELTTPDAIIDKIAYTLANPVAAGLVREGRSWPGLRSTPADMGTRTLTARRPARFFRKDGSLPAEVRLQLTLPPIDTPSEGALRTRIESAVADREDEVRSEMDHEGKSFLGRRNIRKQGIYETPSSAESRFGLNPKVAGRDKWKRIEALTRLRTFLDRYRDAKAAHIAGEQSAVFPAGTWLMRIRYGVACEGYG